MNLFIGVFVITLLVTAGILVWVGIRQGRAEDPFESRLADYVARGEQASIQEIELSQPFFERVILPTARKMGEVALRFTPQNALQDTGKKLEMAGNPRGLEPAVFFALRFGVGIGTGIALFLVFSIAPEMTPFSVRNLGIITLFMLLGFNIPNLVLGSRIARRQKQILKAMPDALDLLTIAVEAGLGFDGAMKKVHEKWDNELALSFGRALQEMQLGKLRRDALRDMSERLGVAEMHSFVAAIIQSESLGVSMAKILRIQSDDMRVKRRQRAEAEAQKAPVKMLFPMALLIFPTIMLILLGPAILLLMRSTLGSILF